jgi:outer membrane protein assembly factor BamD
MLYRDAMQYSVAPPRTTCRVPRWLAASLLLLSLGGCSVLDDLDPFSSAPSNPGPPAATSANADPSTVPVEEMYNHGVDAMNAKNYSLAVTQFDNVEQYYPYSSWAVNAQLMQGYSEYLQNHYTDAIGVLDRYIQLHPSNKEVAYAYYLRALCFYEQIADVSRDQKGTAEAMAALQEVVNRFPDSAYGRDARLKIDLARDHLAGKEMAIGRWYENQHLYTAAIGRFERVVEDYQTTNHVPEALHRLTEIYLKLGLRDQARKTAAVLGYNYPGNIWYDDSYNQLVADKVVGGTPVVPDTGAPARPGFLARTVGALF